MVISEILLLTISPDSIGEIAIPFTHYNVNMYVLKLNKQFCVNLKGYIPFGRTEQNKVMC